MPNWQLIVDIFGTGGSLLLTLLLVLLYRKQTRLNEYEMNRDARKIHTDVLRDRVRYWLGETDDFKQTNWSSQPQHLEIDSDRLPNVFQVDVESAPDNRFLNIYDQETEFRVVPGELEDDRYLSDFLENHAGDVKSLVSDINDLYDEFVNLRRDFVRNCPPGQTFQTAYYRIYPISEKYEEWLFERVILMERGIRDINELKSMAESGVIDTAGHSGEDYISFRGTPPDTSKLVYKCELETIQYQDYHDSDLDEEVQSLVVDALQSAIEDIDVEENPYNKARKAAILLDEIEERVDELKQILIIYEGRPMYRGDCVYLDEAQLD